MLTIVWDVDDVLNDLMRQWFECEWLTRHPDCALGYEDLKLNPPHSILGVETRVYLESLDRFRAAPGASLLNPNAEVLSWFRENGAGCRHIALTARPLSSAPDVAGWVMRHFSRWIRCFGVLPSRPDSEAPIYDRTKADFLRWIKAGDVLIDDTPENRTYAEAAGIRTLAFPQPWSGSQQTVSELLRELTLLVNQS
jgi:hypothetical protein